MFVLFFGYLTANAPKVCILSNNTYQLEQTNKNLVEDIGSYAFNARIINLALICGFNN